MHDLPHDVPVTVVIPCYNHAHYLGDAIESVLAQTYPHVEIVVVDDGSTDDTREVAARYVGVRYVWQANRGLAAARNTGLRESTSAYLIFLDADDRLLPDAVETNLRHLLARPDCAFVSGHYRYVREDLSLQNEYPQEPVAEDAYLALLQGNYIGMHATVMYRRTALEAVGGFDDALPACEDYDLYLRLARRFPVCRHGKVVAEYRQHGANMSRNAALMLETALRVLRAQRPYVRTNAAYRRAYGSGIRFWQRYYGEMLLAAASREPGAQREARRILLRLAPRTLLAHTYHAALQAGRSMLHRSILARLLGRRVATPAVGAVRFGDLRRLAPISTQFGYDRGRPIDRYYIEGFLARHAGDVRGRVLEVGDDTYTRRFGGDRVAVRDVLHVAEGHPGATFTGDLATADHIPSDTFDCIILTQTLHLIYDVRAALRTLHRILKPGGVLLATVPGITQIDYGEWGDTWFWSFTQRAIRQLAAEIFPDDRIDVACHGNVLAATAFLQGLAVEELRRDELDHLDPHYQLLITLRAVKPL